MNLTDLTSAQLRQAALLKEQITSLERELDWILGAVAQVGSGAAPKRTMSAAARAKIAGAQRARWAKQKGKKAAAKATKPQRKTSAAGRKRPSKLAEARWAKVRPRAKRRFRLDAARAFGRIGFLGHWLRCQQVIPVAVSARGKVPIQNRRPSVSMMVV